MVPVPDGLELQVGARIPVLGILDGKRVVGLAADNPGVNEVRGRADRLGAEERGPGQAGAGARRGNGWVIEQRCDCRGYDGVRVECRERAM